VGVAPGVSACSRDSEEATVPPGVTAVGFSFARRRRVAVLIDPVVLATSSDASSPRSRSRRIAATTHGPSKGHTGRVRATRAE
jgi:hypothetical protein